MRRQGEGGGRIPNPGIPRHALQLPNGGEDTAQRVSPVWHASFGRSRPRFLGLAITAVLLAPRCRARPGNNAARRDTATTLPATLLLADAAWHRCGGEMGLRKIACYRGLLVPLVRARGVRTAMGSDMPMTARAMRGGARWKQLDASDEQYSAVERAYVERCRFGARLTSPITRRAG